MAGSKNTHRKTRAKSVEELPAFVPQDARCVNHTQLSNKLVLAGCALTISSVVRVCYLAIGIAIGIAAVVFRLIASTPTLVTVIVLGLGLMIVIQGMRLPHESARTIVSRLNKGGDEARNRYYWADESGIDVWVNNHVHHVAWNEVKLGVATQEATCLVLQQNSVLFILDNAGFLRGSAQDFQALVAEHVQTPPRNAIVTWCDKVMYSLDNWRALHPKNPKR